FRRASCPPCRRAVPRGPRVGFARPTDQPHRGRARCPGATGNGMEGPLMPLAETHYDAVIVGAGVSGSFIAGELTHAGMRCICLEAGRSFTRDTYPRKEIDGNALLYWGGGIELNTDASIGFLRPKVGGGGSMGKQAPPPRLGDVAFDAWREESGVDFLTRRDLDPWYDRVQQHLSVQTVPQEFANGNARVFRRGFEAHGY